MNKLKFSLLLLTLSCSNIVQKTAVNTTADIAQSGQKQFQSMNSWEQVKNALPAQLAFAETLLPSNPNNTVLVAQLIKGYAALGFLVHETNILLFENQPDLKHYYWEQANLAYARAINFGEAFLKLKGIKWQEIYIGASNEEKLAELLDDHLSSDDAPAMFFLGQAWASLINLNRDNMKMVNHLPIARSLINYTCNKDANFEAGMCQLFEATFQLSRPKALGGNHVLGNKLFEQNIKQYSDNLLYPVLYAQWVLLPQKNFALWKEKKAELAQQLQNYHHEQQLPQYLGKTHFAPENNLYNTIAFLRFQKLLSLEKSYY